MNSERPTNMNNREPGKFSNSNNSIYQKLTFNNEYIVTVTIFILLSISYTVSAATTKEKFDLTLEMESSTFDVDFWQSAIKTHNRNIYFVWIDKQLRTMIAKKTPNGKISTNVILNKTDNNKHHTLPSLGIDKNGYIHVVYNMHHTDWLYKKSNKPEDISSFSFIGGKNSHPEGIPGIKITYPAFVTDNNGELYLTFRHRVEPKGKWGPGNQGIGISLYNTKTKKWNMLGGTNYLHGTKTFFWSNTGRKRINKAHVSGYQAYRAKIFFDRSNRMHISWDVFIKPGDGASHIMYAYSDDGGKTFSKANGNKITNLPITPNNGDIVESSTKGIYPTHTHVGVLSNGMPMVSFRDKSKPKGKNAFYKIWNGSSWGNRKELPATYPANFITDANGIITVVSNNKLLRSSDNGNSWVSYPIKIISSTTSIDYAFLASTNKLRFQTKDGNKIKFYTVDFSGGRNSNLQPPTVMKLN